MERDGWKHDLEKESPSGYCLAGRVLMFVFGSASKEFYDHKEGCIPCTNGLDREQQRMKKDMDKARRDGSV